MSEFLDAEDLLVIASVAFEGEIVVRNHDLLAAAAARPRATAFGEDAYPTLLLKAAAMLHSLAGNPPLVHGNKRLAWLATYVFLDLNGHRVTAAQDEVVELVNAVVDGTLADVGEIARRFAEWAPEAG